MIRIMKSNNNGLRALAEEELASDGLIGPFGVMKFCGARAGQGWSVDGRSIRLAEIERAWNGTVTAVVAEAPDGGRCRIALGEVARFGHASIYIDTRPFWPDRVDLIAVASRSVSLVRLVSPLGNAIAVADEPSQAAPEAAEVQEKVETFRAKVQTVSGFR